MHSFEQRYYGNGLNQLHYSLLWSVGNKVILNQSLNILLNPWTPMLAYDGNDLHAKVASEQTDFF